MPITQIGGSRLTTTNENELRETIKRIGGIYHSTGKPTYWPTGRNKISDLLDSLFQEKSHQTSLR